jgi:hypothetical protein
MMPATLICHRLQHQGVPSMEATAWDSWLEAAAALYSMPRCGPHCMGHHSICWEDCKGRYHVWQHDHETGLHHHDPAPNGKPVPDIERRLHT